MCRRPSLLTSLSFRPLAPALVPEPHITIPQQSPLARPAPSNGNISSLDPIKMSEENQDRGNVNNMRVSKQDKLQRKHFKKDLSFDTKLCFDNLESFRSFLSEVARLIESKWFKLLLYLQTCAGIL